MSFETTMAFLTHATLHSEIDDNSAPSASIVLGRVIFFEKLFINKFKVPKIGTGKFDVLHKLS